MGIYNTPYTYRIRWSKTGMNYYGVRYAKNCHPSDLFVTYFTSSGYVAEYIKEHGAPDIIQVRRIFSGADRVTRAILHENRVLQKTGAVNRKDYLNLNDTLSFPNSPEVVAKRMATRSDPEWIKNHSGTNSKKSDITIYDWEHSDGTKISCSRIELCERYNLNRHTVFLITKKYDGVRTKSVKGWRLAGTKISTVADKRDPCIYSFKHKSGIEESCTRYELSVKYGLNNHSLGKVVKGGRPSHKGWQLA